VTEAGRRTLGRWFEIQDPVGDHQQRRELRLGFDLAAEDFQRTRPICPAELFDDLMDLAGLAPGDRVIEIGCGTGQATVPLAERGLTVTAIEIGAELAAVARTRLAGFPAAEVVTGSFEDWQPRGGKADAVLAVSALHWIDPELRYARPFELLRPGGVMAVAGCMWARPEVAHPFWAAVQEDYAAAGYEGAPPPPAEQIGLRHFPPEALGFFTEIASRRYPLQLRYSAADYLAMLATQSGTRALGDVRSAQFLDLVRRRLERHGWPDLIASFIANMTIGLRP